MRKQLTLSIILLATAAYTVNAQQSRDVRGSGGIGYLFDPGTIGIGAGFEYVFQDAMSGNISIYSYDGSSIFALDYRYYFVTGSTQVYANAGFSSLTGASGLNLGAGAIFPVQDRLGIGAAFKYELAKPGTEAIGLNGQVGIVYTF